MIANNQDWYVKDFADRETRWIVTLNDGTRVFQDDGRPDTTISAWERLYNHCRQNELYIVQMKFGFRSNMKDLPANQDGYFFRNAILQGFRDKQPTRFFLVGYLKGDQISVTKWRVPEMAEIETEFRSLDEAGISLIRKT